MTEPIFKPGSFYWVIPTYDVDFTPPGFDAHDFSEASFEASRNHWSNKEQPARFEGYDEKGTERWTYFDPDNVSDWSARWVGAEIVPPDEKKP